MSTNLMTRAVVIAAAAAFLSCEPPGETQLLHEVPGVEVVSLLMSDTTFGLSSIDSSALLPGDELSFVGTLVVNGVQHDAGQGIRTASFARAVITDKERPVVFNGRTWGYHGFDLGALLLNGAPMVRKPHIVTVPDTSLPDVPAGFEYNGPPDFVFDPERSYTWAADSINGTGVTIEAPGTLTVQSPVGGSVISRDEDLELRWTSDGDVVVIVSQLESPLNPKPVLYLRPSADKAAIVSAKVLQFLSPDQVYFFTFVRANRNEVRVVRRFFDMTVLVQAASVYNVVVVLR